MANNNHQCTALIYKPIKRRKKGEEKEKYICKKRATYSERGHRYAGEYCDTHGLAIHALRAGRPCTCGQCEAASKRYLKEKRLE